MKSFCPFPSHHLLTLHPIGAPAQRARVLSISSGARLANVSRLELKLAVGEMTCRAI